MNKKLSELSKPVRIHHDWNRASMSHCGRCDQWEMTIADGDGTQTCASCYDAEVLSEWQNYAEETEQHATALLAKLEVKDKLIIGLERHVKDIEATLIAATDEISDLEKERDEARLKLATPVRLSESTVMSRRYVVEAIRTAGFTVEGDEQ